MFSQCCSLSFSASSWASTRSGGSSAKHRFRHDYCRKEPLLLLREVRVRQRKSSPFKLNCLGADLLDPFWQLAQNKVLLAAGVSAAIGQLSKPFTSVLLYGKDLDFRAAVQAGGFPSTHSSAVMATATIIGLERGFSDSIFGLTVVYAGLVMYDAQGVRREVGNHSKVLNKVLAKTYINSVRNKDRDDSVDSQPGTSLPTSLESRPPLMYEEGSSFASKPTNSPLLLMSDDKMRQNNEAVVPSALEGSERTAGNSIPLKESIGHTEFEVIAGALLGVFVSLALCSIS